MNAPVLNELDQGIIRLGRLHKPESLIVVLHGCGQQGEEVRWVADRMAERNPSALVLVPTAPNRHWFDPSVDNRLSAIFHLTEAAHRLNRWIDREMAAHGLHDNQLAIFGFSMGGMVALYSAYNRSGPCALTLCHSSVFAGMDRMTTAAPTMLVMGKDNIASISPRESEIFASYPKTVERLRNSGVAVSEAIIDGQGHWMSAESIALSAEKIATALKTSSGVHPA